MSKNMEEAVNVEGLNKGDIVYCCRILPVLDIFEINKCKVRTIEKTYFVTTEEKTKQAFMFAADDYNKIVFKNRKEALKIVNEAEAEDKYRGKRRS